MYDFKTAANRYTKLVEDPVRVVAFDFETTGLNLRHGDNPFMMSATFADGENWLWQAEVNPFTRKAVWSPTDVEELRLFFNHLDWRYIGTNVKFDARCAGMLIPSLDVEELLYRSDETIAMHHAIANRDSHALKDAAAKHGGIPDNDERDLHEAVKLARIEAKALGWAIASPTTCPQVRKAPTKGWGVMDMWVPRQLALHYWRNSEAYTYLQSLPKRPRFKPNVPKEVRVSSLFSEPVDPTIYDFIAPTWCELTKEQKGRLVRLDGWRWHPPEFVNNVSNKFTVWHPWHTLCATYCQLDTLRSVTLFDVFKKELIGQGLWDQYMEHRINTVMTYRIEENGVSYNARKAKSTRKAFAIDADYAKAVCGYTLSPIYPFNPNSHDRIREVLYGDKFFGLPVTRLTVPKKKGAIGRPTTDKDMLAKIIGDLASIDPIFTPERSIELSPPTYLKEDSSNWRKRMKAWHLDLIRDKDYGRAKQLYMFCASLLQNNKSAKGISQIDNFDTLMLGYDNASGYATLYSSINPYGTDTTRQSASNPNPQNISKGGKNKGSVAHLFKIKKSLRGLFGPHPGREWWRTDYKQIQLFIFFFLAGDERLIKLALQGEDFHSAVARILFGHSTDPNDPRYNDFDPKNNPLYAEQRDIAKNVNFAFAFGAGEAKINLVCGVEGMYDILCNRMPSVVTFLEQNEWQVRNYGYIKTAGGYRLNVNPDKPQDGTVYRVQGTEGEIVKRATYGVQDYLDRRDLRHDMYITIPVHDELDYDAKLGVGIRHIRPICQIMEDAAESFGFPCKVDATYCPDNWGAGEEITLEEEELIL